MSWDCRNLSLAGMADPPRTVAARLTPEGRGGIAVVLVRGPDAITAVDAVFRSVRGRSLHHAAVGRLLYGRIGREGLADEVVVQVVAGQPAPEVEISCHGGLAAVGTVLDALAEAGVRACTWPEMIRRRERGLIRAEALEALAAAPTARAADLLLDQYHGALDRDLESVAAGLHAGAIGPARAIVRNLLDRASLGLHLARPWTVATAGRPNVGKSSLLNRVVGYDRAIVDPTPGTTRDVVTAATALDGWPVEWADTAGLRDPAGVDGIEEAGIHRARQALDQVDCPLVVLDASRPLTAADRDLLDRWPGGLRVANKSDLPPAWPGGAVPGAIAVSARTGEGLPRLLEAIARRLVPAPPPPGSALPFTGRQVALLERLERALIADDRGAAARLLIRLGAAE